MNPNAFLHRHIGLSQDDEKSMLQTVGMSSIDELISKTIPQNIRLKKELDLDEAMTEQEYLNHIQEIAGQNESFKSYIGLGYHDCITPSVIQRNVFENPGWYTAYTPYQAEISQGRLEALLNFQTMVSDLTGMELANASLLDESTAAAEAMTMFYNLRSRAQVKEGVNTFLVDENCFPQTIDVLKTKAIPFNIELKIINIKDFDFSGNVFGAIVQYPNKYGEAENYQGLISDAHENEVKVAFAADILSLVVLTPPGEWNADVVLGTTQRFGVPMGYGGPHAAYFATKRDYKRYIPGRIIGVSLDKHGNRGLRMALQTREQHIKRDRATSNICTAQALLAVMAGMYAVYHGPDGLKYIASKVYQHTTTLKKHLVELGYEVFNTNHFDTITVNTKVDEVKSRAEGLGINLCYHNEVTLSISVNEKTTLEDLADIISCFGYAKITNLTQESISDDISRKTEFLTQDVFKKYHSESEMMRYLKSLENKDISLVHSMISLGSCTMKLNAATQLMPLSNPKFANIHPFVPLNQTLGYQKVFDELEKDLAEITGFSAVSLQPNSGAQGEYTGLMTIRAYHLANNQPQRNIVLIPSSAHGTNPASAIAAGMKVIVVKCDEIGNIDVNDLKKKVEKHSNELSSLMVTYPSTHGVFEEAITEITDIIHQNGGLVYMDGANMNAQVGLTNPGNIGADVCHLNLHKTFAIPHGGGGPGMGPIAVNDKLASYLPKHTLIKTGGEKGITAVSAAPWGSSLILLISYAYIKMLGKRGLKKSTEVAILNANYIKAKLEEKYSILYTGENGTVAHEMILDCREFKKTAGVEVEDIAKRLIDYGFHAPTVSFPVAGTLMVEPTESESKAEIDRFCNAMLNIYEEITEINQGIYNTEDNVLKQAPHTAFEVTSDQWLHQYSRQKAVYSMEGSKENKFWVSVGRVDNAYGDRNLCACIPIDELESVSE